MAMKADFETVSSTQVYSGAIFDVLSDEVRLPNGNVARRDFVKHSGAVTILPVGEGGTIYLIEQFRYPTGGMIFEIPAGTLEEGEERDACARRELAEEIGFRAGKLELLRTFYPCPGYSNELITLYRATELEKTETNFDENEIIELRPVTLEEGLAMIENGRIVDAKTIIALYHEKILRNG